MIEMYCDQCGKYIPHDVKGGVRVRIGDTELSFHLCRAHQEELRSYIKTICTNARTVQPQLRRPQ